MMRGRGSQDGVCLAEVAVYGREALQETRHGAWAYGVVPADLDVALAERTGYDANALLRFRLFDPKEVFGKPFAKPPVHVHETLSRHCAAGQPAAVDPFLDLDMGLCFELQVSLVRLGVVVLLEGSLDVDRVGVVSLDQVAVVAVHGTDERRKRRQDTLWQAAAQTRSLHGQFDCEVGQGRAMPGGIADEQRLHPTDVFAAVGGRVNVRFHDHLPYSVKGWIYQRMVRTARLCKTCQMTVSETGWMRVTAGRYDREA